MAAVTLESVTLVVDDHLVLDAVDLTVHDGEMMVLLGPSGSGKSSILRVVAGLEQLAAGTVTIGGLDMAGVATRARDVAMVHQHDALFPTKSVRANVSFSLSVRDVAAEEIDRRVRAESRALAIADLLDRHPADLADGERQLVQIARAMVRAPKVFLLDEPLARIDVATRERIRAEIRSLQSGYGVAAIYATNDPEEAMAVADRIAVVIDGRVVAPAEPRALWFDAPDRAIAELAGPLGALEATVEHGDGGYWVRGAGFRLRAWAPALEGSVGKRVVVGVRPDGVRLDRAGPISGVVGPPTFRGGQPCRDLVVGTATVPAALAIDATSGATVQLGLHRWQVFAADGHRVCTIG